MGTPTAVSECTCIILKVYVYFSLKRLILFFCEGRRCYIISCQLSVPFVYIRQEVHCCVYTIYIYTRAEKILFPIFLKDILYPNPNTLLLELIFLSLWI